MNNQSILLILGAAIGSYYLMNKDREGFRFADELPAGNAFTAPPSFPQPAGLRAVPQYESISQMSGDNMLLNKQTLTSSQVDEMLSRVGKTTPQLQDVKDIMPTPDMRYSAGLDPTDPNNFIYERTLFAPLKRRNYGDVDYFRGDLEIMPERRGWFDTRSVGDKDVVQGYFSNYTDIQQNSTVRDSIFERTLTADQRQTRVTSPYGINSARGNAA
jgi:hypothetical protein